MKTHSLEIIEIKWEGPFSVEEVRKKKGTKDFGVYQVYGANAVYGSDTLLYIGKANELTFGQRFDFHEKWICDEPGTVSIYIGRLGASEQPSDAIWGKQIDQAEAILLYFATPLYNKKEENVSYSKPSIVLNFHKCNKLPLVVSNLYEESSFWVHEWNEFEWKKRKKRKVNKK